MSAPLATLKNKKHKVLEASAVEEGGQGGQGECAEVWVGAFGRWYAWRWESDEGEEEERMGRLARGVLGMDVEEDEDDKGKDPSCCAVLLAPVVVQVHLEIGANRLWSEARSGR
jgi:hypothetical protein